MSLAITDLMVAVLVMPLGILTLVKGLINYFFPYTAQVYIACRCRCVCHVSVCDTHVVHTKKNTREKGAD